MIKNKTPNPLELFKLRQVSCLPPHFELVQTPIVYNMEASITAWIKDHLKGRFYIGRGIGLDQDSVANVLKIGFEDPKEASYFMLACPHLKYK